MPCRRGEHTHAASSVSFVFPGSLPREDVLHGGREPRATGRTRACVYVCVCVCSCLILVLLFLVYHLNWLDLLLILLSINHCCQVFMSSHFIRTYFHISLPVVRTCVHTHTHTQFNKNCVWSYTLRFVPNQKCPHEFRKIIFFQFERKSHFGRWTDFLLGFYFFLVRMLNTRSTPLTHCWSA